MPFRIYFGNDSFVPRYVEEFRNRNGSELRF